MQKYPVAAIRDSFDKYISLLNGKKNTTSKNIVLNGAANNKNYLEESSKVVHVNNVDEEIKLIIRVSKYDKNRFEFKLLCSEYCPEPFFRFETDGVTHRNLHIPLKVQPVPPPHFHKFHETGYNIAYKTPPLLDRASAEALKDIHLCIHHFCHEGNLRYNDEDFPELRFAVENIPFPNNDTPDPLANFNF